MFDEWFINNKKESWGYQAECIKWPWQPDRETEKDRKKGDIYPNVNWEPEFEIVKSFFLFLSSVGSLHFAVTYIPL